MLKPRIVLTALLILGLTAPSQALSLRDVLPQPPTNQSLMPTPVQGCCKVCRKGKACGDSCISRDYECHVGPGCACNG